MKYPIFLSILLIFPLSTVNADDSERNPIAKQIKKQIIQHISNKDIKGFCDVFIELSHSKNIATVKRVTGTGDYRVCKASKKAIKKGKQYKYRTPEKYLRIHIAN